MSTVPNSYVTMADAEEYFSNRLDVAAWTEASLELREQALVTATMALERYVWIGRVVDVNQPLSWPRTGSFFDPRLGYTVDLSGIPQRIKTAQLELAYHYLNNDGVLDSGGGVSEVKVGPIHVKGIESPSIASVVAQNYLAPLLASAGGRQWWRAN